MALVINEIDYDQAGTDAASFIELYNSGPDPIDLGALAIVLVDGLASGVGTEYARFLLSDSGFTTLAAGAYLVIGNASVTGTLPVGTASITVSGDFLRNGTTDAVALIDITTTTVLDSLSYAGSVTMATITGFAAPVNLVEGAAFTGTDTNTDWFSLARVYDGLDSDTAASDWRLATDVTPGAANTGYWSPVPGGPVIQADFTSTATVRNEPTIAALADGGFLVVWNASPEIDTYDILAQRYDATGAPVGGISSSTA